VCGAVCGAGVFVVMVRFSHMWDLALWLGDEGVSVGCFVFVCMVVLGCLGVFAGCVWVVVGFGL